MAANANGTAQTIATIVWHNSEESALEKFATLRREVQGIWCVAAARTRVTLT
jgi:hypothetical protein